MRAFIEATMVDQRYRDMWWYMRERHIVRVSSALQRDHGISKFDTIPARTVIESLASMTEQSAFVWYADADADAVLLSVEEAAKVVSDIWYLTLFRNR
jgi:hypothetical protein